MLTVRPLSWGLFLIALPSLAGCGSVGTVSGSVRYGGKPISAGTVTFYCANNRVVMAPLQLDGSYASGELPVGKARVSVNVPQPPPTTAPPPAGGPIDPRSGWKTIPIPPRYADPNTSGLEFTVRSGSQTFPIELTD